jgi:hypothetical protein
MQGSEFNRCLTEEDKRIGFQQGYRAVAEWLRAEISPQGSNNDASEPQVNKLNEIYFKLNTLPISLFDVKFQYKVSISVLSKQ